MQQSKQTSLSTFISNKKDPLMQMYKCGWTTKTLAKSNKNTRLHLDGLDLEVQTDETEDETLQVLDQVVEDSEALRVPVGYWCLCHHFKSWMSSLVWNCYLLWLIDINQGTNFGSGEWDVLISNDDLQFLWGPTRKTEDKLSSRIYLQISNSLQLYTIINTSCV